MNDREIWTCMKKITGLLQNVGCVLTFTGHIPLYFHVLYTKWSFGKCWTWTGEYFNGISPFCAHFVSRGNYQKDCTFEYMTPILLPDQEPVWRHPAPSIHHKAFAGDVLLGWTAKWKYAWKRRERKLKCSGNCREFWIPQCLHEHQQPNTQGEGRYLCEKKLRWLL